MPIDQYSPEIKWLCRCDHVLPYLIWQWNYYHFRRQVSERTQEKWNMFGAEFESSWLNPDSSTKRNPNQRRPLHGKEREVTDHWIEHTQMILKLLSLFECRSRTALCAGSHRSDYDVRSSAKHLMPLSCGALDSIVIILPIIVKELFEKIYTWKKRIR